MTPNIKYAPTCFMAKLAFTMRWKFINTRFRVEHSTDCPDHVHNSSSNSTASLQLTVHNRVVDDKKRL